MLSRLVVFAVVILGSTGRSADDLQPQFEAFAQEKSAAVGNTSAAEKLAAKAEEARKAENLAAAARLIRDARWALPVLPLDLPEGVRAIGYSRLRHGDRVNSLRYNRDGTRLVSASADRTVRVWDVATGRELSVYRGHLPSTDAKAGISNVPLKITDAVFLPDGVTIASAGEQQIHLWDSRTGKTLKTLIVESPKKDAKAAVLLIKSLDVSDDGKTLVSGSDDKIVRLWNLETGKEVFTSTPHSSRIECVAYQPKGKFVAAVDADGFLSVYDPTGENKSPLLKVQVTDGGSTAAFSVRFTPDGAKIFTGGGDKSPRLTPAPGPDGAVPPNVAASTQKLPAHSEEVLAVGVTADGKYYVSGGRDKAVRVVDNLGQIVRAYSAGANVTALAVRPDGLQIAAAGDDGSLRVWDFLAVDDHRAAAEAKSPLWAAATNADGSLFAAAGADKTIRIYSMNGKLLHTLEGSTAAVTSLLFLTNDRLLSAGGDKVLRLWDAKTGKPAGEWLGHPAAVLALAATPDGKTVVSGSADKTVNGWNASTGKILWTWTGRSAVTALAISNDGARVFVGCADGGLTSLVITENKPALEGYVNAHISGVASLALNTDGSRLASAGGDGIPKIWKLPASGPPVVLHKLTPALKPTTPTPVALSTIAFSPDGRRLAAAGADRIVRLYDTTSGFEIRSLRGCTDWVTSVCFSPDGERLFAVAADAAARLFDLTQADATRQSGHTSAARAVSASKDGKLLASVGSDRMIRVWDRATGAEVAALPVVADTLFCVSFVNAEMLVTGGSDRRLRLWSLKDKKELSATAVGEVYGITVAPDGTKLGVWSRASDTDTYSVYEVADLAKNVTITEKGRKVSAATFAPDLSVVVSADEAGAVIVHDFATKASVGKEWKLAKSRIADIGFSADRKLLAVIDDEGTLSIGDFETRSTTATGKGPADGINGLLVAPAGNRLVVLGTERQVFVYDLAGQPVKTITLPGTPNGGTFSLDGKTLFTANADGSLYAIPMP